MKTVSLQKQMHFSSRVSQLMGITHRQELLTVVCRRGTSVG